MDLGAFLKVLGKRGIVRILVEGGGETIESAFRLKCVNEFYFFIAPKIIGGRKAVSSVGGEGVSFLRQAVCARNWDARFVGKDLLVHGVL